MLRLGRARALLVGGVEELCIQTFLGFYKLGLLATSKDDAMPAFAPCSGEGTGTLLGEGAAFLVLELQQDALKRKAPVIASLAGYGSYFDPKAVFRYDSEGRGAREAVTAALDDADIRADQLVGISRSANGINGSEQGERAAIDTLFAGSESPISSLSGKELFGETFSADGALRLAMALGRAEVMSARRNGSDSPKVLVAGSGPVGSSSAVVAILAQAQSAGVVQCNAGEPARAP
jgi:3-oxoacyl-[acyl-carrier-protein] synthase II